MFSEYSYFPAASVALTLLLLLVGWFYKKKGKILASGRHVFVTGCDTGFGLAVARQLNDIGVIVVAGCLSQEGVARLNDDATFLGEAILMDVTKREDVDRCFQRTKEIVKDSGLWGIVNNAGIVHPGLLEWQTVTEMRRMMDVNLWGAVDVTKTFLPLVKSTRGRIVNITSIGGRIYYKNAGAYSMTKYALEAFSDGLRSELRVWGVGVHIIEPGITFTNMSNRRWLKEKWMATWQSASDDVKASYGKEYCDAACTAFCEDTLRIFGSKKIYKVVDAVRHALFAKHACTRYVVGADANLFWVWLAIFPTSVGDFVMGMCEWLMPMPKPQALQ